MAYNQSNASDIAMQPYRDVPSATQHPTLQDYYDDGRGLPPPHRLSSVSYNSSPSPYASTQNLPLVSNPAAASRGAYTPATPSAAAASTSDLMADRYNNIEAPGQSYNNNAWLEKQQNSNKKAKWIVIGSVVGLLGLAAIGVGVGVSVAKRSSNNSSSASSSSSNGVVTQTDPNDPSTFEKDSRLIQSFYGIAYTPEGSQYPACGNSLADVITDIQLISQLTSRIRLYGADCNQSALVLEAIKQTKVNMTVWLANYNVPNDETAYDRQKSAIQDAIKTYGTDHIGGVTVGNEYILNYLNANGATDPNGAVGNAGAKLLNADIDDTKQMLSDLSVSLQVGNADAGSYFNNEVLANVDYGMANVHPWFANVSIDQAADWTAEFFQTEDVDTANALSNKPKMYIAETGWPSNSSDVSNESNGPSTASEANLQKFLDTFVCQANTNGTGYFYFEYFDEEWKDEQYGGVEGWWGLFYRNRTLKNIEIPNCPMS